MNNNLQSQDDEIDELIYRLQELRNQNHYEGNLCIICPSTDNGRNKYEVLNVEYVISASYHIGSRCTLLIAPSDCKVVPFSHRAARRARPLS